MGVAIDAPCCITVEVEVGVGVGVGVAVAAGFWSLVDVGVGAIVSCSVGVGVRGVGVRGVGVRVYVAVNSGNADPGVMNAGTASAWVMVTVFSGDWGAGRKYLNAMAKPSNAKAKFSIARAKTNRLSMSVPASLFRGRICDLPSPKRRHTDAIATAEGRLAGLLLVLNRQFCSNQPRTPVRAGMREEGIEVIVGDRVVEKGYQVEEALLAKVSA